MAGRFFNSLTKSFIKPRVRVPSLDVPRELIFSIVLYTLADEMEDIAFTWSYDTIDSDYSTLKLLRICSIFRSCTIEALKDIWCMPWNRYHNPISSLRWLKQISSAQHLYPVDIVARSIHEDRMVECPVTVLMLQHFFRRIRIQHWRLQCRAGQKQSFPRCVFDDWRKALNLFSRIPERTRNGVLGNIIRSFLDDILTGVKLFQLGVCTLITTKIISRSADWTNREACLEAARRHVARNTNAGRVDPARSVCSKALQYTDRLGLNYQVPTLTHSEDVEHTGVKDLFAKLSGHEITDDAPVDPDAAWVIRTAVCNNIYMLSEEEVALCFKPKVSVSLRSPASDLRQLEEMERNSDALVVLSPEIDALTVLSMLGAV